MRAARCPICRGGTEAVRLPVSVRRGDRVVFVLQVPAARCAECGHVDIDEAIQEEVIAELERHSRPGDDLIFPEIG